jgi:hypothetical protein
MTGVRTTISIDDELFRRVKAVAAADGRTLGDVVSDALRLALDRRAVAAPGPTTLPTFGGSGTLPGVDLSDSGSLRDLMDGTDPLDARR